MPAISIDTNLLDKAHAQRCRMAQLGRKGGKATVAKLGREHMRSIGRAGFAATVAARWQGDRKGFLRWLRERAAVAVADALADVLLDRQLADGAAIACCELSAY